MFFNFPESNFICDQVCQDYRPLMGKSKDRYLLKLEQRKQKKDNRIGGLLSVYEKTWVPGKVTINEYVL